MRWTPNQQLEPPTSLRSSSREVGGPSLQKVGEKGHLAGGPRMVSRDPHRPPESRGPRPEARGPSRDLRRRALMPRFSPWSFSTSSKAYLEPISLRWKKNPNSRAPNPLNPPPQLQAQNLSGRSNHPGPQLRRPNSAPNEISERSNHPGPQIQPPQMRAVHELSGEGWVNPFHLVVLFFLGGEGWGGFVLETILGRVPLGLSRIHLRAKLYG